MKIYDNVLRYCEEEKISIHKFEVQCGIGNGTVGRWKNEMSQPSMKTLTKIILVTGRSLSNWIGEDHG